MHRKWIDDLIISSTPTGEPIVALVMDIEVNCGTTFPEPEKVSRLGQFDVISIHITGMDGTVCFAYRSISSEWEQRILKDGDKFILCKDEEDMISRAITLIDAYKPTHTKGDFTPDAVDMLYARARAIGVKVIDLDQMFSRYDIPFSEPKGHHVVRKNPCPIAAEAWNKYKLHSWKRRLEFDDDRGTTIYRRIV